jgi:hypothetical protein
MITSKQNFYSVNVHNALSARDFNKKKISQKSNNMNTHKKILKNHLQKISTEIYHLLEVFNSDDIFIRQINEDGISSIILKKIAKLKNRGYCVRAKSLNVHENETGVDFDLWIGEDDEKYIRLLIQAKSFKNNIKVTDSYILNEKQCENLITHSKEEHKAFPIYFFYQHLEDRDLKTKHFPFIKDFKNEYSSITFASAYSVLNQIKDKKVRFSDIHENKIEKKWVNDIYSLLEDENKQIGLPLYLLYDLSPSQIEKFLKLIDTKNNSAKFLLLLLMLDDKHPFEIHKISANEIEKKYGFNESESAIQRKNLLIINDKNKFVRDRVKKLKKIGKV